MLIVIRSLFLMALLLPVLRLDVAMGEDATRPNIVLVMADDMGYAQTGYLNHPLLRTPNLDRMASGGLRLDRFYAGGPVCSPTRASVLTGRTHERCGVVTHGFALRHQEKTISQAIQASGYATGHFGKWHLNGLKGPGVPILAEDSHHPGTFGFDTWVSASNYFDRDPVLSRRGKFEAHEGDSCEVAVAQMLQFASRTGRQNQPFFSVVWFGTPHSPFVADPADVKSLADGSPEREAILKEMDDASRQQYGELVALDRSLGTMIDGLSDMGLLDNTLIWFTSDNGGLPNIQPSSTTPFRGHKGNLYEGGLRVPCVLHWPKRIAPGGISTFPACATDIAPTLVDLLSLPNDSLSQPNDGISLVPVLDDASSSIARKRPLGFRFQGNLSVIDNDWKLIQFDRRLNSQELYHLSEDIAEEHNLIDQEPEIAARLSDWLADWNESVQQSIEGKDYPEQAVAPEHPEPRFWQEVAGYQSFLEQWKERPEYANWLKPKKTRKKP